MNNREKILAGLEEAINFVKGTEPDKAFHVPYEQCDHSALFVASPDRYLVVCKRCGCRWGRIYLDRAGDWRSGGSLRDGKP